MNTTLALAFFWFLFASSSGFGVTGDFSKNKLQYDIANVRQLPISYKVFRKIIENYLRNNNHGLDDVQGKYGHFLRDPKSEEKWPKMSLKLRDRRSGAEEDVQMLPWQMEYFNPRLRRDARAGAVANKEDGQLLPWEMEYFTPRLS